MTKARSLSDEKANPLEAPRIQLQVWCHIAADMDAHKFKSPTESYEELVTNKEKRIRIPFPVFNAEEGCNGLAVIFDKKISCIDIFGTEEIFQYYFPKLKEAAFLKAQTGQEAAAIDPHEAKFRVLDELDKFELTEKTQDTHHPGAGTYFFRNGSGFWGFDLEQGGEMIHRGLFVA